MNKPLFYASKNKPLFYASKCNITPQNTMLRIENLVKLCCAPPKYCDISIFNTTRKKVQYGEKNSWNIQLSKHRCFELFWLLKKVLPATKPTINCKKCPLIFILYHTNFRTRKKVWYGEEYFASVVLNLICFVSCVVWSLILWVE